MTEKDSGTKNDWPLLRIAQVYSAAYGLDYLISDGGEFEEEETYIPESMLLSDEVIDIAHSKGSMADPQLRPVNRAVIVAAIKAASQS